MTTISLDLPVRRGLTKPEDTVADLKECPHCSAWHTEGADCRWRDMAELEDLRERV